jgi:hypothetical protein
MPLITPYSGGAGSGGGSASVPGIDLITADPQTLVLDRVYSYNDLSNDDVSWYTDSDPGVLTITADTNRALPAGSVGDVVGTISTGGNDGIYVVTSLGSVSEPWVLTRHPDYSTVETVIANMAFKLAGGGGTYFLQVDRGVTPSLDQYEYAVEPAYAEGPQSHAEGAAAYAQGHTSHAEGYSPHAEGYYSHAEGSHSHAEGFYSHAEGRNSHTEGGNSHAEGYGSHAEGDNSHAGGLFSHAEGSCSHAEGHGSHAGGYGSHAEAAGQFAVQGDAQFYRRVRKVETYDATPAVCVPYSGTDVLQANKTVMFAVQLVASRVGGAEQKGWFMRGAMTNVGGTPALVGTVTAESWGVPTWTAAVVANTDGPRVVVEGEASKTIRWVATIEQTEAGI